MGRSNRTRVYWAIAILACAGSFGLGWLLNKVTTVITIPPPLRLGGYQYISPLISCNLGSVKTFLRISPLQCNTVGDLARQERGGYH